MANGSTPESVKINIGGWLQAAWEYFVEDAIPWVLMALIYWAVILVLSQVPVIGQIALLVLNGPLMAGFFYAAFCRMRGTPATVGMMFTPMQTDFVPLMLVGMVGGILGGILTLVTCGLGVVIVFPMWMFAVPLVLERQMGFWDALELGRKTFMAQLGQWILFGLVCLALLFAGAVAFGIGVLVTLPLVVLLVAQAYSETFGLSAADAAPTDESAA